MQGRHQRETALCHINSTNSTAHYDCSIWSRVSYCAYMKTTMNLDDALVREAMAIHRGKTKTAVVELGLQELVNADRRRRLAEAFGSQPDLRSVARRRSAGDSR